MAAVGVFLARKSIAEKATLDLIERQESTEYYQIIHRSFYTCRTNEGQFDAIINPISDGDKKMRQQVLDYLNRYELVAIGIDSGILSGKFYAKWMKSPIIRDWNAAANFIQRERWKQKDGEWEYHKPLFASFQGLAEKWGAEEKKKINSINAKSGRKPSRPEGPGDQQLSESIDSS